MSKFLASLWLSVVCVPLVVIALEGSSLAEFLAEAAKSTQMTELEFERQGAEFERSQLLSAFDGRWTGDEPWIGEARGFLSDACKWLGGDRRGMTEEVMRERARSLLAQRCGDPMVRTLAYTVFGVEPSPGAAVNSAWSVIRTGLSGSRYPAYRKAAAQLALIRMSKKAGLSTDQQIPDALSLIKRAIGKDACEWTPGVREYVWRKFHEGLVSDLKYGDLDSFHKELARSQAGKDPWMWHMTVGVCEYRKAWLYRGGAFWSEIPETRRASYIEMLDKAVEHFLKAAELEPTNPAPQTMLLMIAVEGGEPGGKSAEQWFRECVGIRFDLTSAYYAYRRNLQTRWGGGPGETLEFAKACIDTGRFDTYAPLMGLEAIEQLGSEIGSAQLAWSHEQTTPSIDAAIGGYLADPNSPVAQDFLLSAKAAVAWWRNDFVAAFESLPCNDQGRYLESRACEMTRVHPESVLRDAIAIAGPRGHLVVDTIAAADAESYERALGELGAQIDEGSGDGQLDLALRDLRARLVAGRGLAGSAWAAYPFEQGLPAWRETSGVWEIGVDGRVVAKAPASQATLLLADLIGNRVEMEQSFEIITPQRGEVQMPASPQDSWGFVFAFRDDGYGLVYRSVTVHPAKQELRVGTRFSGTKVADLPPLGDSVLLRAAIWDDWISVWVDGENLYAGQIPGDSWQPWGYAGGIGGTVERSDRVSSSGFRLRALDNPPEELAALVPPGEPPAE